MFIRMTGTWMFSILFLILSPTFFFWAYGLYWAIQSEHYKEKRSILKEVFLTLALLLALLAGATYAVVGILILFNDF